MKKVWLGMFALIAFMISVSIGVSAASGDVEKGKEVYAKENCRMCHLIDGKGNKKWPLDGVGSRLNEEQIRKWIRTPKEMNPKAIMKAYSGISDSDLADLTAYLMSLKK
jgi:cytochrome c2